MFAYQTKFNSALTEMFARMNPNAALVHFPEPRPVSVYPPPDTFNDEEVKNDA